MAEVRVHITCPRSCRRNPGSIHIDRRHFARESLQLNHLSSTESTINLEPHERGYTCVALEYVLRTWIKGRRPRQEPAGTKGCFAVAVALWDLQCRTSSFQQFANEAFREYFEEDMSYNSSAERKSEKWAFIAVVFGWDDIFYRCITDVGGVWGGNPTQDVPHQWDAPIHTSVLQFILSSVLQRLIQDRVSNVVNWYYKELVTEEKLQSLANKIKEHLKHAGFNLQLAPSNEIPASLEDASRTNSHLPDNSAYFRGHTPYDLYQYLVKCTAEKCPTAGARADAMPNLWRRKKSQADLQRVLGEVTTWYDERFIAELKGDQATWSGYISVRQAAGVEPSYQDLNTAPGSSASTTMDSFTHSSHTSEDHSSHHGYDDGSPNPIPTPGQQHYQRGMPQSPPYNHFDTHTPSRHSGTGADWARAQSDYDYCQAGPSSGGGPYPHRDASIHEHMSRLSVNDGAANAQSSRSNAEPWSPNWHQNTRRAPAMGHGHMRYDSYDEAGPSQSPYRGSGQEGMQQPAQPRGMGHGSMSNAGLQVPNAYPENARSVFDGVASQNSGPYRGGGGTPYYGARYPGSYHEAADVGPSSGPTPPRTPQGYEYDDESQQQRPPPPDGFGEFTGIPPFDFERKHGKHRKHDKHGGSGKDKKRG